MTPLTQQRRKVVFVAAVGSTLKHFVEPLACSAARDGWQTVGCAADVGSASGFGRTYELPPFRRRGVLAHLRCLRALSQVVREERPSVLHLHTPSAVLLGRIVGAWHGVPVVAVIHGTFLDDRSWKRLAFVAAELATARRASLTVTVNDRDFAFYARLCRSGSVVNAPVGGMGLDPRIQGGREASSVADGERSTTRLAPSLLYLGRLAADKNLDRLIEAWNKAKMEIPDLRLRIVGSAIAGDPTWSPPNVEGIDVCPWTDDPFAQLRGAAVAVTASRREGFSMFVAESLVCGTPVVAVANRGNRAIAGKSRGGVTLVRDDADEIAEAMVQAINNPPPRVFRSDLATEWSRGAACSFHLSLLEQLS